MTRNKIKAIKIIIITYSVLSFLFSTIKVAGNNCDKVYPFEYIVYSGLFCEIKYND